MSTGEVETTKTENQDNGEIPPEWRTSPEKETKKDDNQEKQDVKESEKEHKDYRDERKDYRRDRRDDYGRKKEPVSLFVRGIEPDVKYVLFYVLSYKFRTQDLWKIFEKYGQLQDVYIPKDYHTGLL